MSGAVYVVDVAGLLVIADEMRSRKVNHGRETSPTLIAWADRIEAAVLPKPSTKVMPHEWCATGGCVEKRTGAPAECQAFCCTLSAGDSEAAARAAAVLEKVAGLPFDCGALTITAAAREASDAAIAEAMADYARGTGAFLVGHDAGGLNVRHVPESEFRRDPLDGLPPGYAAKPDAPAPIDQ